MKNFLKNLINYFMDGDWGLGIGDWGLGIGPNPQSPIPTPQSPIPTEKNNYKCKYIKNLSIFLFLKIIYFI